MPNESYLSLYNFPQLFSISPLKSLRHLCRDGATRVNWLFQAHFTSPAIHSYLRRGILLITKLMVDVSFCNYQSMKLTFSQEVSVEFRI
uniref:Peroxiredoxin Qic n=1 Tax=Rhizophora mucronata TaxID=61149 RepID=A0A2P2KYA5_RHIMU